MKVPGVGPLSQEGLGDRTKDLWGRIRTQDQDQDPMKVPLGRSRVPHGSGARS